jgi:RNA polymerase sigma factor (sigma-70 family)
MTPAENNQTQQQIALAREHISLATQIAYRLSRRYAWVGLDDLHSYAYIGLSLAAKSYDPSRGLSFARFACSKAMFLAIDEMRKNGVLRRADASQRRQETAAVILEMPDPQAKHDRELLEAREFCAELVRKLDRKDRQLLSMVYVEKMTYREIAKVYHITESAVCLRHKALLGRLRQQSTVRQMAA